jgi:hypothetical protein
MPWPKTLEKPTRTFQILNCQRYKIHLKSRLFLPSNLKMKKLTIWLLGQTLYLSQKEQVFWSQRRLTKIRMGHIRQRNPWAWWWKTGKLGTLGTKSTWKSRKNFIILLPFLRKISTKVWSVYSTEELFPRMLISPLLLRKVPHLSNSEAWSSTTRVRCMPSKKCILKSSAKMPLSLIYSRFREELYSHSLPDQQLWFLLRRVQLTWSEEAPN